MAYSRCRLSDRAAAVEAAMKQLESNYGAGAVMRLGDHPHQKVDVIPSGSISLDDALGSGGFARGRITELFGPEGSGKTTVTLHAVANAQRLGLGVLYVDSEHAIDPIYAAAIGVDIGALILAQPDTFEIGMEIALAMIKSGGIGLVVIDSVAALIPRAELEGNVGDAVVGLQARLMSQTMRKITGPLAEHNTAAIFINQLRSSIAPFGPTETTTGGKALKFYSSMRLDIRRIETLKAGEEAVGNRVRVKVVKNKLAVPLKQAMFDIQYGHGISREAELLDLGVDLKIVKKSGAWYSYGDMQIGQGKPKSVAFLAANPEISDEIEESIRGML